MAESTLESEENVFELLVKKKEEFKERILAASRVGLKVEHKKRYGTSFLVKRYPNAVVSLEPKDAHLFLVLLDIAAELSSEESNEEREKESVPEIMQHETEHIRQILESGGEVEEYGLLITTDKDGGIISCPFVSYKEGKKSFWEDLKTILAPLRKGRLSREDFRDLIRIFPEHVLGKVRDYAVRVGLVKS